MYSFKKIIACMIVFCGFLQIQLLYGISPISVEVIPLKTTICIGEPLIVKLIARFETPQKNLETGNIYSSIGRGINIFIEVKVYDDIWLSKYPDAELYQIDEVKYYPLDLSSRHGNLYVQDEKGLEYSAYFLVVYNRYKNGLLFDKPGTYKVTADPKGMSNVVDIKVISCSTQQMQCVLPDPNYYDFISGSEKKIFENPEYHSKLISDLKNLVEECPDSILAKWAAARVGLESYYEAEKKRTELRREKKPIDESLWDESAKYLRKGLELPDDFSVREAILYHLAEIAYEKKNYSEAIPYLDELGAKYPKGRYGKEASDAKRELLELQEKKSRQTP